MLHRSVTPALFILMLTLVCGASYRVFAGGNVQGTSCTAGVSAGIQTGAVTDANNLVCVSGTWQYPVYVVQSAAAAAGSSCSSYPAGAVRYNTTLANTEFCNGSNWQSLGVGGAQLIGVYSSGSAVTNNSIVFTGSANSAPSLSGSTLTLPSNTAYIVVELWGAGGGGSSGGSSNVAGSSGGTSCFGTNSTACTSPAFSATAGSGGNPTNGATGGSGSGGDINLIGTGTNGTLSAGSGGIIAGSAGGSAPLGGGGAPSSYGAAGVAGNAYGGGGSGGANGSGNNAYGAGVGGGGGGYASKLIANPSGTYYYTIGGGGSAGSGGGGFAGAAGGAGGITISVYTSVSSASNGTISSAGAAGDLAYYAATGTNISPLATANNGVLATNSSGTPFISTAMTVTTTSVGIGTTSPSNNLQIGNTTASSTSSPVTLSLGGTYSSTAGQNAKLKLYDSGGTYTTTYGFGVSAGSLDAMVGSGGGFNWYESGTNVMTISSSGLVGIGKSSAGPTLDVNGPGAFAAATSVLSATSANNGTAYCVIYGETGGGIYACLPRDDGWGLVTNANIYVNGSSYSSDARLKDNVHDLDGGLATILKLRPVSFTWKLGSESFRVNGGEEQYGLIAQEAQKVLPNIVVINKHPVDMPMPNGKTSLEEKIGDIYTVDYSKIVPHLIGAVQELKAANDNLRSLVTAQGREIEELKVRIAAGH